MWNFVANRVACFFLAVRFPLPNVIKPTTPYSDFYGVMPLKTAILPINVAHFGCQFEDQSSEV
jgi:hypothetical protein